MYNVHVARGSLSSSANCTACPQRRRHWRYPAEPQHLSCLDLLDRHRLETGTVGSTMNAVRLAANTISSASYKSLEVFTLAALRSVCESV